MVGVVWFKFECRFVDTAHTELEVVLAVAVWWWWWQR